MEFLQIQYSKSNAIATITLNTPQNRNAFNERMCNEVCAALQDASEDASIRAIVLTGTGKAFSGGGDIKEMANACKDGQNIFRVTVAKILELTKWIITAPKPVIASVSGAVAGAAFNIAIACDFCIATENATFIQAFANIGLIPDAGGLFLLSRSIGVNRAMQLAMLGTPVSAAEGKELGFVYQVCRAEQLEAETASLARRLANGPTFAYGRMKQLLYESQYTGYDAYAEKEVEAQYQCGFTDDFKEGIFSFTEKRKPEFHGK
jgi:trans-2-decenoyl-[acyl-carrier protein] isomerase